MDHHKIYLPIKESKSIKESLKSNRMMIKVKKIQKENKDKMKILYKMSGQMKMMKVIIHNN